MLVHVCCSVDSHYFLQEVQKKYPKEKLVAFFYNPNIHPEEEYNARLLDVKRSCRILNIELIVGDYDFISWFDGVKGFEEAPEKGDRCSICFDARLLKTAHVAAILGESKITTTLLASPMKDKNTLFLQGDDIAKKHGLEFIKLDVRSNGGTQVQSKLAKEENLYRQNYCGCKYALDKQRANTDKVSIELFNHVGGQILPSSPKDTLDIFMQLGRLETNSSPYILHKNHINTYRLLSGILFYKDSAIPSYIFAHSKSCKKLKSKTIKWCDIAYNKLIVSIGFSDNIAFIDTESINKVFCRDYKSATQMLFNPPLYNDELRFRQDILGVESIIPFVAIDSKIRDGLTISIESIFQSADRFSLVKL